MANHSTLALRYVVKRMRELSLDPEPVLARYGLDLDKMAADSRIDCALELRVFCSLLEQSDDPLAGLKLGSYLGITGYGPLSMLLMTCATPWAAMQATVHFQPLTYLFSQFGLVPGQSTTQITLQPIALPERPFRARIDLEMAGAYRLIKDMQLAIGIDLQPEQVSLPYPKPVDWKAYEEHFNCPVSFADTQGRLFISNSKLHQPVQSADAIANAMYWKDCEKLREIALRDSGDDCAQKVREHLALFQDAYPTAPAIAAALGMSERSLRNHLARQEVSYRQLLDETRYAKACRRLQESRDSIETISRQLGYAEPASFIHAFQRWADCSPSQYRRQTGLQIPRQPLPVTVPDSDRE